MLTAVFEHQRASMRAEVEQQLRANGFRPLTVDFHALAGQNLWQHLHDRRVKNPFDALIVIGSPEQAPDDGQPDAALQLNVQRDSLRRDFVCPWVLVTSPRGAIYLRTRAPDFTDFVSLWLEGAQVDVPTRAEFPRLSASGRPMVPPFDDPYLQSAVRSAQEGRFDEANDTLSRYDLAGRGKDAERQRAEATLALLSDEVNLAAAMLAGIPSVGLDPDHTARLVIPTIQVHLRRGEREAAQALLGTLNEETLSPVLRAGILELRAAVARARGDHAQGLSILKEQGLPAWRAIGSDIDTLRVLDRIAGWLADARDFDGATDVRNHDIGPLAQRLGAEMIVAENLSGLATLAYLRGEKELATAILRDQHIPLVARVGTPLDLALAKRDFASLIANYDENGAEVIGILAAEVLPELVKHGTTAQLATAKRVMAVAQVANNRPDEAIRVLAEEVIPAFQRSGSLDSLADAYSCLATGEYVAGRIDASVRVMREQLLPALMRLGDRTFVLKFRLLVARILARLDDPEADTHLDLVLDDPLLDPESQTAAEAWSLRADLLRPSQPDEAIQIREQRVFPVYERLGLHGKVDEQFLEFALDHEASGHPDLALSALARIPDTADPELRLRAALSTARIALNAGEPHRALTALEGVATLATTDADRASVGTYKAMALHTLGRTDDALRQLRDDVLPVARSVPEARDELLPNLLTTLADWLETRNQGADRRRARDLRREAADLTGRDNS